MPEAHSGCILMYGRDFCVLDTRRMVLENAGFKVVISQSASEARGMMMSESPALFILCHSLRFEDCEHILRDSHQLRPEMVNLVLTASRPSCPEELAEEVLCCQAGPAALIRTVSKVLHRRQEC